MSYEQFAAAIEACDDCAAACDYCATACLAEPDPKPMARCISLDLDCAAACRVASAFLARDSEMLDVMCEACAEICDECAEECAMHDMEHCQACADACRACAEECRRVANAQ